MSNLLRIPFNKIRSEGNYKEILEALERGFNKFGIDFYLVGATARDVWMRGVHGKLPKRATSDIDFGIMIKDSSVFDELKDYLIKVEGFVPYKENAFVLIWKDKTQVDLFPFGELEKEGVATVRGTGFTSMSVEGFKEEINDSFLIACLLHDCAHAPFSHTFEGYYVEWFEKDVHNLLINSIKEDSSFSSDFSSLKKRPSPHEIVSALIAIEKFRDDIKRLYGNPGLIVRMIIGCPFNEPTKDVENCMISLLNGSALDVDKLDYIMRDSWASGTNNVKIDLPRLLSSILIRPNAAGINKVFFTKRSLNVIKNVIDGRNFLYQWIYTHHTVLYEQYLIKESIKAISKEISCQEDKFLKKLFSLETFSNPVKFKGFCFYLPCDGDLIYIIKQFRKKVPEVEELLSRKYNRKALWKTTAEYIHYFSHLDEKKKMLLNKSAATQINTFLKNKSINPRAIVLDPKPKTIFIINDEVMIDIEGQDVPYTKIFPEPGTSIGTHCFIPYLPFEALDFRNEIIHLLSN